MKDSFLEKAELHYKKREFKEALDTLFTVWRFEKSERVAYLILASQRQMFHYKSAEKWLVKFDEKFPKSKLLETEKVVIQYETKIRPLMQSGSLEDVVSETEAILKSISDKEFIKKIVFSVVRKAKDEKNWQVAGEWLTKLDIKRLSKKQAEVSGKKRISERQRYYLSKFDIHSELNDYEPLLDILTRAQEDFPDIKLFQKQYLDTLFHLKRYDQILDLFNTEMNWHRPNWGLVETASNANYLKGDFNEAWRLACLAFNSHGAQKVKVELHLLISKIAEKLGNKSLADDFKTLSILVRSANKLEITSELMEHLKIITDPTITADIILEKYQDEIQDGIYVGKERHEGKIVWFPMEKNFAKIEYSNGKSIIIFKDNIDIDCRYEGAKISFIVDKNIDPKSGEEKEIARAGRRINKLVSV